MSKETFDPLDNEKTLNLNLEDSLGDMPTMNLDQSGIGRVDRYELLEKLGEGGFGAVYGAKDTEAGILVALKALPAEVSCDPDEMASIRDNFALVSKLHHPNIASLLHLHRVERADERAAAALGVRSGDYLTVMEYAPGATCFAVRRAMPEQKLGFSQALEICRPIADALDFSHSLKVLHRDIKPKNVMIAMRSEDSDQKTEDSSSPNNQYPITNNGTFGACTVKVLDFGLAAEIRSSMSRKSKEPKNSKSGTPLYMAPEQWEGKRQDGRADQYALAVFFYELISGEVPFKSAFDSGNFEIMRNVVLGTKVEPLPELTKKQNAILLRALAKDPSGRFESCGEFIDALCGKGIGSGRGRAGRIVGITLLLVVIVGGAFFTLQRVAERQQALQEQTRIAQDVAQRQRQIEGLMQAAVSDFSRGDIEAASGNVSAILVQVPAHPEALALRDKIEQLADERKVREVKARAEVLAEDALTAAKGKAAFEAEIRELRQQIKSAEAAHRAKAWGEAFTAYRAVLDSAHTLQQSAKQRSGALEQKKMMLDAKNVAEQLDAPKLKLTVWDQAVQKEAEASDAFLNDQFIEAGQIFNTALSLFVRSGKEAKTLQRSIKEQQMPVGITRNLDEIADGKWRTDWAGTYALSLFEKVPLLAFVYDSSQDSKAMKDWAMTLGSDVFRKKAQGRILLLAVDLKEKTASASNNRFATEILKKHSAGDLPVLLLIKEGYDAQAVSYEEMISNGTEHDILSVVNMVEDS